MISTLRQNLGTSCKHLALNEASFGGFLVRCILRKYCHALTSFPHCFCYACAERLLCLVRKPTHTSAMMTNNKMSRVNTGRIFIL